MRNARAKSGRTVVHLNGQAIGLGHLDRILFPDSRISKRDLIDYYRRISRVALPHYRDRPATLQRFPDGIAAPGFFQKNRPDYYPDWIDSVRLSKQNGTIDYVLVNQAATLVYLADQACITFHLALARASRPRSPDRLIFDLDPPTDDFGAVRVAALRLKALLDELGLTSFVQTTGSRGLHIVIPLDGASSFDTVRQFARRAAETLAKQYPESLTVEQRKERRDDKVFIDYLRNAYGQTAVAPYSVRAIEGAPVATPIRWDEVEDGRMHARRYSIANVIRRLGQLNDPWADISRRGQSLDHAIARIGAGL